MTSQQLFLVLVQALEKMSTTSHNWNFHIIAKLAGAHNPAECSTVSGFIASIECVLAFLGGVHEIFHGFCINSDSFGQQLLDICFIFHPLTALWSQSLLSHAF